MNKKFIKPVLAAMAMLLAVVKANGQTQIFTTESNVVYRIPSIVRLVDGRLWAFSDLRHGSNGDIGIPKNSNKPMRIDIAGKIGTFNGNSYSWDQETTVVKGDDNAADDFHYTYSDAATVVDRESGKVLIMCTAGKLGVGASTAGYPLVARSVFDKSWTTTNVTSQLYGAGNLYGSHLFVSSGRIIQSTIYKKKDYYRIYAGVCSVGSLGSRVVYSDDFGETWHYLGGYKATPVIIGNECKIEELPDGSILLNTRTNASPYWGRHFNIYTFSDIAQGTGTWQSQYVTSGASNVAGQTYAPDCNAEILLVPAKRAKDNVQTYVLLLSAPTASGRKNVSIYWKELPANYTNLNNYVSGWTKYAVDGGKYFGYSTMVLDKQGDVAFLSENSAWMGSMTFKTISLSDITGSAYVYSPSATGTYHTTSEPTFEHGVGGLAKPTLSVNGGVYKEGKTIELTVPKDTKVFYTLDGSEPVIPNAGTTAKAKPVKRADATNSTKEYTGPIELSTGSTTLKAVAVDANNNRSQTLTASYYITSSADTPKAPAGKTGTTVSLDNSSSIPLYSSGASQADKTAQTFAYFRHKNAHLQLISSSYMTLASGMQLFAAINNNLNLTNDDNKYISLYNGLLWESGRRRYIPFGYFALLAPKGVRFLRFQIVLDKTSKNGAHLTRYKYGEDGSFIPIDSVTASSAEDVTFDRTLEDGSNVIYFRMNANTTNDNTHPINLKSFKVTYAIDDPFEAQVPNANGNNIHTGFINLGQLGVNTYGYFSFQNSGLDDYQSVRAVKDDGTALENVTVDDSNYFMATAEGNYYVEAPAKFRIVGATVNFKRAGISKNERITPNPNLKPNNVRIVFQANDDSQNYLQISEAGSAVNVTSREQATVFTLNYNTGSGENHYSLKMDNGKYLSMPSDGSTVNTSDNIVLWAMDTNGLKCPISGNGYRYLGNNADNKSYQWDPRQKGQFCPHIYSTAVPASDFTGTVFNREDTGTATDGQQSLKTDNSTASVTVSDMNNDAIHINLSGINPGEAALFNVKLKLIVLDPEIATVEAAAKTATGTGAVGNSPVTSYNYIFNDGNVIGVPVPSTTDGTTSISMVFRNAKNEEQTLWYDTKNNGNLNNNPNVKGGYSNLYLIGSQAELQKKLDISPRPDARTAIDQAGTVAINTTNIEELAKSTTAGTLQDKTVDNALAGNKTVTMTLDNPSAEGNHKFYLYGYDQPTYQIMPKGIATKHYDFRFYTINVKPVKAEEPKIEIVEIYKETMKGGPHKETSKLTSDKNEVDKAHTYVGVKVSAQLAEGTDKNATVYGALTAEQIYTKLKEKLNVDTYGFKDDPLRGVLYVDMSSLSTVTTAGQSTMQNYANETADNCLFFMPQGFAGTNLPNVISKQADGSYQAFGDVTVYDQQPFFTPYDFSTGTFKASYTREATVNGESTKSLVKNMAAVLPFEIRLDGEGHPYLDGTDQANQHITFRNIIESAQTVTGVRINDAGEREPLTYLMEGTPEAGGKATANTPYYVSVDKTGEAGFTFNIPGAKFTKTGTVTETTTDGTTTLTATPADLTTQVKAPWTGYGTYAGCAPAKADDLWYFSNDLFWKSGALKTFSTVNVRPFRAYYKTTVNTGTNAKAAVVYNLNDFITTAIQSLKTGNTNGKVYTLDGRYVGNSLQGLAPGIYIRDGRKVVKP